MIIPSFLRFYPGYTLSSVISEKAVTFFSLANDMNRLEAQEMINDISAISIGMAEPKDRGPVLDKLSKASAGVRGIVNETLLIKKLRGK